MQIVGNRSSQTTGGEELIFFQSLTDQYYREKKIKLTRKVTFLKRKNPKEKRENPSPGTTVLAITAISQCYKSF